MAAPRTWHVRVQPNADTDVTVKAAVTGRTHYITKVVFIIVTHTNAKYMLVRDASATYTVAKVADLTKAAGVPDMVEFNYPKGFAVTISEDVELDGESAGHTTGVWVYVEGFTV